MSSKYGAPSPVWSTQSTNCSSSTPRSCFDNVSSDEEDNSYTKPFSISDALQSLFIGACYSTAPSETAELVTEVVTVMPSPAEERPAALPTLLGETKKKKVQTSPGKRAVLPTVRYNFDRLEELGVLGYGAFGSVTLVKCHITGQVLALKKMSKGMIIQNNMAQHLKNEKMAMRQSSSPFVIKLAACFNRPQHLYFLMEAATGGDLFSFYKNSDAWGSEAHARFYIACIASALNHLHSHHIIYRDVKLENVVLDARGYAKLCDFGLARFVEPTESRGGSRRRSSAKAYTTCGTPEYMAPETVGSRGYSVAADWWSLGVLAFSILTGKLPFNARNARDIMVKARAGINRVKFPQDVDWPELVQGLCAKDPSERLPIRNGGIRNMQELAWYQNGHFDWTAHGKCKMVAPHIPPPKGPNFLCDVDLDEMEPPPDVAYVDPHTGWDADFEDLEGPSRFHM